jgi:phosphate-selective porin OprO/OprP
MATAIESNNTIGVQTGVPRKVRSGLVMVGVLTSLVLASMAGAQTNPGTPPPVPARNSQPEPEAGAQSVLPAIQAPVPDSSTFPPNMSADRIRLLEAKNEELSNRLNLLSALVSQGTSAQKDNATGEQPELEGLRPPQPRPLSEDESKYRQRAEAGAKTRTKKEAMTRVGFFFWRDNTKEFEGRGPYEPNMEPIERKIGDNLYFGDGVIWRTQDKYFTMTFHNLTQLDLREPVQQGDPLHGGFVIPRQRWYFQGRVGDYADFVTSINRGYSTLDVLDSYVDFVVNREWLKFRVGRFKMPSQYEYIEIAEGDLLGPERSLFVANYAANRQLGAAAQGYLFDERIRYYFAVSNGLRRSFEDFNSSRDYFFFVDFRPFNNQEGNPLRYLHLVGTYNFGEERQPLSPFALRTLNQLSQSNAAAFVSPTILEFNTNVFEDGPRAFWGFEPWWYYKSMGLMGSIQGGYQDYATSNNLKGLPGFQNAANEFLGVVAKNRVHVPINGWAVGGWWFITGEQISARRFLVEPIRPFGYYNGTINPGAFELFCRYSTLQLGNNVFTTGLVDPKKWTNRAQALDLGVSWYLTHYVKFTFDWQHTFLGNPVVLDAGSGRKTNAYDMFLFRTQLFF